HPVFPESNGRTMVFRTRSFPPARILACLLLRSCERKSHDTKHESRHDGKPANNVEHLQSPFMTGCALPGLHSQPLMMSPADGNGRLLLEEPLAIMQLVGHGGHHLGHLTAGNQLERRVALSRAVPQAKASRSHPQ